MLEGVNYLHKNKIFHGDISSGNLMFDGTTVKIIDLENYQDIPRRGKLVHGVIGTV